MRGLFSQFLQIALLAGLTGWLSYAYSPTVGLIALATLVGLLLMQIASTLDGHRKTLRRLQGMEGED